jgi:putative membrane protein
MKVNKLLWCVAIAGTVMASGASLSAAENNKESRGQLGYRDYRFLNEAAHGGMMEVRLGEIAKQKASSQAVRDFAQRMITDHSKANDELKQVASTKGAVIPMEVSRHENSMTEKLEKLSGRDFDREYMAAMVKDHKKDAKEFEDAVKDVTDPELKAFAQKTLNVIQDHLRMARETEASVK